jgi:hypothetical protein
MPEEEKHFTAKELEKEIEYFPECIIIRILSAQDTADYNVSNAEFLKILKHIKIPIIINNTNTSSFTILYYGIKIETSTIP